MARRGESWLFPTTLSTLSSPHVILFSSLLSPLFPSLTPNMFWGFELGVNNLPCSADPARPSVWDPPLHTPKLTVNKEKPSPSPTRSFPGVTLGIKGEKGLGLWGGVPA